MAKAIKSMSSLETQIKSLLTRVDFDNFDFGSTRYDKESNQFVLENASDYDNIMKQIQTFKKSLDDSKDEFIATKERESYKELADKDEHMKNILAQYFG